MDSQRKRGRDISTDLTDSDEYEKEACNTSTTIDVYPFVNVSTEDHTTELTWEIKNFWKLRVKEKGDCITSEPFHAICGAVWTLALYPVGNRRAHRDFVDDSKPYISLYLRLHDSSTVQDVHASFKFYSKTKRDSARGGDQLLYDTKTAHRFLRNNGNGESGNSWGFPKLMERGELSNTLDDGVWTIRCVIRYESVRSSQTLKRSISAVNDHCANRMIVKVRCGRVGTHRNAVRARMSTNRVSRSLQTLNLPLSSPKDGFMDTITLATDSLPDDNLRDAIINLITESKVEEASLDKLLEMTFQCHNLGVKLAERILYSLIVKQLTLDEAIAIIQYPHFEVFDHRFVRSVLWYIIHNIKIEHLQQTQWEQLEKERPALFVRLFEEIMNPFPRGEDAITHVDI